MKVYYPSLESIILANKKAVRFTGDEHGYTDSDLELLRMMLAKLKRVASREPSFKRRMVKKASFLMYGIARGQRFYEGNKRTSFLVTREFLRKNGYTLPTSKRLGRTLTMVALDRLPLNSVEEELARLVK